MHLLYTLTAYPPYIGGAQLHQHLLGQQLHAAHSIQVATFWNHNRTDWLLGTTLKAYLHPYNYVVDGISVHRLAFSWADKLRMAPWLPLYYPWMAAALPPIAQVIAKPIAALAHTSDLIHNVRIGREGLTYASLQVARQRDIPFVLTPVHHPRWVGWRYREYLKLYQQADAVIALTQAEAKILADLGVARDRIHVTGHGPVLAPQADPSAFRAAHGLTGPVVLFLGQHYPYKGYRQVLEATLAVWAQHPDTHFVFVGPAVKTSEAVFTEFADPRIHRLGAVSRQDKTNALAACDLLCVPSSQESFGGVYTEAWSFKKPVIGCNIPAVAEVVSDGQDGYLVEQSAAEISDRIIYLLSHANQRLSLGQAGYDKVQQRYSWPHLGQKTLAVYQDLLS
ncbi:glycosyltransferase family 4 protein [Nodosilinea sp. LEGE 07298]|uniref:glycosyltransferase family 4 protein n=1 Tax=Nodosilinea sp. LEGE 07298 TaxID=2777970 RepID=UPI00187ED9FD|nr:glycosyltransferase family 4 protein [Nodosilinea sp. LEGE 07298]MBE9112108.1 glycosyltransferase family 4 protein [Nodosilinea sp. LEGE 07298]